jgi:hypothetical protein
MAQIPNPPQFEENYDMYKMRTFVDDMIRALRELNNELESVTGSAASSRSYPPQLGHARI